MLRYVTLLRLLSSRVGNPARTRSSTPLQRKEGTFSPPTTTQKRGSLSPYQYPIKINLEEKDFEDYLDQLKGGWLFIRSRL
ncbi:hypothetical protein TNCV_692951 [Trichonephila clavipes]|nr:hypothetical protein TNCV_692951 [Trichonephila clavipes]